MQVCPESIALDNEGQRVEGIFQKMKAHEDDQFLGWLLSELKECVREMGSPAESY